MKASIIHIAKLNPKPPFRLPWWAGILIGATLMGIIWAIFWAVNGKDKEQPSEEPVP